MKLRCSKPSAPKNLPFSARALQASATKTLQMAIGNGKNKEEMKMNRIVKFAASLLVFAGAMVSCQKETLVEPGSAVPTSFTAAFEQTKVTIDGFAPKFEIGDEIGIEASTGAPMTTAKATFQVTKINADGSADLRIKGSWSGTPVPPYYVYKGSVSTSMIPYGASMMVFNLPYMELNAASDKIDKTVLFGKTDNLENGVTLLNACALLKVTVSEPVKMIKVAAQNGYVSPQVNVNFANNTIMGQNNINEFVYANATGMIAAGTYYIPFAPTQPAAPLNGLKVGYSTDGTEFIWREKAGSIAIERNKIYDLGSFADWPKPGPVGPTADDFAGTYSGGLSETMKMGAMTYGTQDRSGITQDFVFEAAVNGDNNILMTKFYGTACSVQGIFDPATLTATFSTGTISGIQGTGNLTSPLVLVLSNDYTSLTQVGVAIIQPTGVPFTLEETLTTLTKQNVGPVAGFRLEDVYDYGWAVTYKANGVAKAETSGSNTTFSKQTEGAATQTGCNLFISYFMCGYNTGYANFDLATGTLTIPQARNAGALYFPAIDNVAKYLNSDVVMQMSEDKKTIVATGTFQLKDGTTISDYTFTRQ